MDTGKLNLQTRMRLALRTRSVERGGPRPFLAALTGARATRFAGQVLARYGRRVDRPAFADFFYQRVPGAPLPAPPGGPAVTPPVTHRHAVQLALRLSLTLLDWRAGSAAPAHRAATGPAPRQAPQLLLRLCATRPPAAAGREQGAAAGREEGTAAGTVAPGELSMQQITREVRETARVVFAVNPRAMLPLILRAERVPMVAPGAAGGAPAAAPAAANRTAAPVPRVVMRPAPAVPAEAASGAPAARGTSPAGLPTPITWPGTPTAALDTTLDQAQVTRLADQVVRVIDDRIIARRERMGRA
jgi:hypothetical protein